MLAIIDTVNLILGNFASGVYAPILGSGTQGLVNNLRDFIAPVILVVTSLIAVSFLVKRQTMQFVIFIAIAIGVFAIFYAPELIGNLGKSVGQSETITWP